MLRRTEDIRCIKCSYQLKGLESNRCPECGQLFDRSNPETYAHYFLDGKNYLRAAFLGPILMISPFIAWGIVAWLADRLDVSLNDQSSIMISAKTITSLVLVAFGWLVSGSSFRSGRQAKKDRKVFIENRKYVSLGVLISLISFCSLILFFLFWIVMVALVAYYS
jgi:hypothetical protein